MTFSYSRSTTENSTWRRLHPGCGGTQLIPKVEALAAVQCAEPDMKQFMRGFEGQLGELVTAALRVGKPLVY